jgi:hypothetical protein
MNWHSFWFNLGRSFLMIADTYVPNAVSLGNHSAITPMEQRSDPNSHGRQCPDVSLFIQCDKLFRALFFFTNAPKTILNNDRNFIEISPKLNWIYLSNLFRFMTHSWHN